MTPTPVSAPTSGRPPPAGWLGKPHACQQLADAAHVRRLRDVGFTVSAISVLLAAHGTESYRQALALQRESLGDELRAVVEVLAR